MDFSSSFFSPIKERVDIVLPILLCLILGALYVSTLLPGTGYWGDTAELQYSGKILGTTHPTGYPLYLMINHVFVSLFPIGSLAYKANMLSVIFALLSFVVLYQTFRLLCVRPYVAFIATLIFGGTYTYWSQSVIAEVYSLNILFASLVIYFLLKWHLQKSNTDFLIGCAFFGVSLGNHLTMILFAPAILVFVLITDHRVLLSIRTILFLILFAIAGMAQYLYIVWRTVTPGAHLYTKIYDLPSFYATISGAESKEQMFAFTLPQFLGERIPWFCNLLWNEYSLLLILAIVGIITYKNRKILAFLILIFLAIVAFNVNFNAFDAFTFFIPAYYIIALLIGLGLGYAYDRIFPALQGGNQVVFLLLLIFIAGIFIVSNYDASDQSKNTGDAQNIEALLKIPEKEARYVGTTRDWSIGQYIGYYLYGEGWTVPDITYWYTPENNMERIFDHLYRNGSDNETRIPVYTSERAFYEPYGFTIKPVSDRLYLMGIPKEQHDNPVIILNRFTLSDGFFWMGSAGMILVGSADEGEYNLTFDARAFEAKTGITIVVNKEPVYHLKITPDEGTASVNLHMRKGKNTIIIRSDENRPTGSTGGQESQVSIGIRNIAISPV